MPSPDFPSEFCDWLLLQFGKRFDQYHFQLGIEEVQWVEDGQGLLKIFYPKIYL